MRFNRPSDCQKAHSHTKLPWRFGVRVFLLAAALFSGGIFFAPRAEAALVQSGAVMLFGQKNIATAEKKMIEAKKDILDCIKTYTQDDNIANGILNGLQGVVGTSPGTIPIGQANKLAIDALKKVVEGNKDLGASWSKKTSRTTAHQN